MLVQHNCYDFGPRGDDPPWTGEMIGQDSLGSGRG
jgi:hypothetical protein